MNRITDYAEADRMIQTAEHACDKAAAREWRRRAETAEADCLQLAAWCDAAHAENLRLGRLVGGLVSACWLAGSLILFALGILLGG